MTATESGLPAPARTRLPPASFQPPFTRNEGEIQTGQARTEAAAGDTLKFFRAWLSDPLRVASIVPSGERLAELMTCGIDAATGPVLELGPGTGVFTRALIGRGVRQEDLTLVELGEEFAGLLAIRHPGASILRVDAARLPSGGAVSRRQHGAAISGLPLLSMTPQKILRILAGTFRMLDAGASLYQFTYGWRCPAPNAVLDRIGLQAVKIGTAFSNVPPASVYRIARKRDAVSLRRTATE